MNAPTPTPIQQAAIILDDFAASAQAAQATEIALYQQNLITTATHVQIEKAFLTVAQDQAVVATDIGNLSSQATLSAAVTQLTVDLNTGVATGVLGIKDTATQQKLSALITALGSTAAQITAAYGGK